MMENYIVLIAHQVFVSLYQRLLLGYVNVPYSTPGLEVSKALKKSFLVHYPIGLLMILFNDCCFEGRVSQNPFHFGIYQLFYFMLNLQVVFLDN